MFGVHGVGGILGALLTGVFNSPNLGQVWIQLKAVLLTIAWSTVVSVVAYKIVDLVLGLRVPEEAEREGLDITSHGEAAYGR